ncbi:MAG TPA: hypothetical protein VHE55_10115 [Fimbriimonadaceae bacterium]|nr:hypothetical protein [Fimbriimonadaceae bacterium]
MKVSVSGKQFVFPRSCACCGAYPLTHLPVSGSEKNRRSLTKGWVWEVPYCVRCKKHVKTADGVLLASLSLVALSVLGSFIASVLTSRPTLSIELGGLSIGAVVFAAGLILWSLRKGCSANCRGLTRSVIYLGSTGPCHSFDIKAKFYAAEFVRANHIKLVNASPSVVSILRGTSFGDFQTARRVTRRRR